jgi:hypothetical protein
VAMHMVLLRQKDGNIHATIVFMEKKTDEENDDNNDKNLAYVLSLLNDQRISEKCSKRIYENSTFLKEVHGLVS